MTYEEVIFYVIAVPTVVGAIGVVTARNVVHSALFLILSLLSVAGIFILLSAEFLAIVQVLIYGGAVTILVLFAMMLTRVRDMPSALDGPQRPFAALAAGAFMVVSIFSMVSTEWPGKTDKINVISIDQIGNDLFTTWAVPFEVASLVLMVALLGAIVLARGEEGGCGRAATGARSCQPGDRACDHDQRFSAPQLAPVLLGDLRV